METASETRARLHSQLALIAVMGSVILGVWAFWHSGTIIVDTEQGMAPESRGHLQTAMVVRLVLALLNGVVSCLPVRAWLRSTALTLAFVFAVHGAMTLLCLYVGPRSPFDDDGPLVVLAPLAWVGALLIYSHPGPGRPHRLLRIIGAVLLLVAAPIAFLIVLHRDLESDIAWLISIGALLPRQP